MAPRTKEVADSYENFKRNVEVLDYAETQRTRRHSEQRSLIGLIRRIWPWFVVEEVHLVMAGFLEAFRDGIMPLSMLWVAPRASKSLMSSVATPAGYLGLHPEKSVMMCSHRDDLAEDFSRSVKDTLGMEEYREVFPEALIRTDIHAAARWRTTKGGGMSAAGVAAGIAGKGFHRGLIDDPLNEQTAIQDTMVEKINNWYPMGFYSRRDPVDSAINITQTRWRKDDLSGYLLGVSKTDKLADQPHVLKIPAILTESAAELLNEQSGHSLLSPRADGGKGPYRFKAGDSFAPRRFPLSELLRIRANQPRFESLYQQNPTEAEGSIYKRRCWRPWLQTTKPPECFLVLQIYDTNFEEDESSDYCARTTWGLFEWDGDGVPRTCAILLEAWRDRPSFHDLMVHAEMSYREFDADLLIIEKKASGHAMLQECRRKGLRSKAFKPLTISKTARAKAASIVLEHGNLWYMPRKWAIPVIDECTDFPSGDNDDWVDTVTMMCLYLRVQHLESHEEAEGRREREVLEKHFEPAQLA
jgi:predicted phage terminase large subunit-like protein